MFIFDRAIGNINRQDINNTYKRLLYASYFGYLSSNIQSGMGSFLFQVYNLQQPKNPQLLNEAEKYYLKALGLNRMNGDIYVDAASFYSRTGRPEVAEKYLDSVVKLLPYNQRYQFERARFYRAKGNNDKAIQILKAIDIFYERYAPLDSFRVNVLKEFAEIYKIKGDLKNYNYYSAWAERLKKYNM